MPVAVARHAQRIDPEQPGSPPLQRIDQQVPIGLLRWVVGRPVRFRTGAGRARVTSAAAASPRKGSARCDRRPPPLSLVVLDTMSWCASAHSIPRRSSRPLSPYPHHPVRARPRRPDAEALTTSWRRASYHQPYQSPRPPTGSRGGASLTDPSESAPRSVLTRQPGTATELAIFNAFIERLSLDGWRVRWTFDGRWR